MSQCPFSATSTPLEVDQSEPAMQYGDYLHLNTLLHSQQMRSPVHDEMLFIIQHQAAELWIKLMMHEIDEAILRLRQSQWIRANQLLDRAGKILSHMIDAWRVLATLSTTEFLAMRPYLGSASGHQSYQFRQLEFLLGNKNAQHVHESQLQPSVYQVLSYRLQQASLYDEVVYALADHGFSVNAARLQLSKGQPVHYDASVEAAWLKVYRHQADYPEQYRLAETLVEFEEQFRHWRFKHIQMVDRIIGRRSGTGGSSGFDYLCKTLDFVLFPELWRVRTHL